MLKNGYYYITAEVAANYTGYLIVAGYENNSGIIRKAQYLIQDAGFKWRTVAGTLTAPIFGEWCIGVTTRNLETKYCDNIDATLPDGTYYTGDATIGTFPSGFHKNGVFTVTNRIGSVYEKYTDAYGKQANRVYLNGWRDWNIKVSASDLPSFIISGNRQTSVELHYERDATGGFLRLRDSSGKDIAYWRETGAY